MDASLEFNKEIQFTNEDNNINNDGDLYFRKILISENTIPGLFISIMNKLGKPITENELYNHTLPRWNNLRKPDGSKYKDNMKKVIKSTLCCSGIFQLVDKENKLWFFKAEDATHYINRINDKFINKKNERKKKN